MKISTKQVKVIGIVGGCLLAITCIWLFCPNIAPKDQAVSTKQEQTGKTLDEEASKKLADELTNFSNINTKHVDDPEF